MMLQIRNGKIWATGKTEEDEIRYEEDIIQEGYSRRIEDHNWKILHH